MKNINQSCVIFLGAGASVTSGIPTAKGIVDSLSRDKDLLGLSKNSSDYFQTMNNLAPNERKRLFHNFITKAEINETHLILSVLVHLDFIDTIITTNFDPLVEKSLTLFNENINVIDVTNNVNISGQVVYSPTLYYLHGKYDNIWQLNTLIELQLKRNTISNLISELVKDKLWIIIGYSGNDPVFDEICKFEKFGEGLFWIGYKNQEPSNKVMKNLLNHPHKETYLINGYDSDKFFIELFKQLKIDNKQFISYLKSIPNILKIQDDYSRNNSPWRQNQIRSIKISKSCATWIRNQTLKPVSTLKIKEKNSGIIRYLISNVFYFILRSLYGADRLTQTIRLCISLEKFDTALEILEPIITKNPENYIAQYYNGILLALKAETFGLAKERKTLYKKANKSFDAAKIAMQNLDPPPHQLKDLNNSIISFWATEYNMGVKIQKDDNLFKITSDPYKTSLAHFENAATINPDSAMTYQVISSTHFQLNEIEEAISTYETAVSLMEQPMVADYEYLVSLYLYNNQFDKALEFSYTALEKYPDETIFIQFLADAYIQHGERERAIELIEGLIENEPNNPQYKRVLGTQIYQSVDQMQSHVSDLYKEQFDLRKALRNQSRDRLTETEKKIDAITIEIDKLEEEIHDFTKISIREMKHLIELEPDSEDAHFILGIIYQNKAANFFAKRNNTSDNQMVQQYEQHANENLEEALVYYKQATEINPENPENWQSLFQVFTSLGMEKEAEEALSNIDDPS